MMVAGLDDPEATAAGAVRLGQHGQSDGFVNPPPYLGFVIPPEHPLITNLFNNGCKQNRVYGIKLAN